MNHMAALYFISSCGVYSDTSKWCHGASRRHSINLPMRSPVQVQIMRKTITFLWCMSILIFLGEKLESPVVPNEVHSRRPPHSISSQRGPLERIPENSTEKIFASSGVLTNVRLKLQK